MQKEAQANPLDQFIDQCKEHGLKITPQRVTIFKTLHGATHHPTADQIYQEVMEEHPNISFETVNRTLLKFADMGILNVIESFSSARRFDPNPAPHHHLHCISCGDIIDFKDKHLDELKIPIKFVKDYKVVSKRVVVNVICKNCQ